MHRFTRRDFGMLTVLIAFVVAVSTIAAVAPTNLALGALAILMGTAAVAAHVRFVIRRRSFQHLAQESRANRDTLLQIKRFVETLPNSASDTRANRGTLLEIKRLVDTLPSATQDTRANRDSLLEIKRLVATPSDGDIKAIIRTTDILRRETERITTETSALRSEVRGVRVSQQLFSQALSRRSTDRPEQASEEDLFD